MNILDCGLYKLTTDRTGKAHLLAFIRFIKDAKFVNEYLFCKEMTSTVRGEDIIELINKNVLLSKLLCNNCAVFLPIDVH